MANKEELLNMRVSELLAYCNDHLCSECKLQEICLHKLTSDLKEITLISLLSFYVETLSDD